MARTRAKIDYSTKYEGKTYDEPLDFVRSGRAEDCVFAIHGALMLGTSGVPEALRYLKAWADAAAQETPRTTETEVERLRSGLNRIIRLFADDSECDSVIAELAALRDATE